MMTTNGPESRLPTGWIPWTWTSRSRLRRMKMKSVIDEKAELLKTRQGLDEETAARLGEIDMKVRTSYTLADAMREGSAVSEQAYTWTQEDGSMCALSAAVVSARSRGYL